MAWASTSVATGRKDLVTRHCHARPELPQTPRLQLPADNLPECRTREVVEGVHARATQQASEFPHAGPLLAQTAKEPHGWTPKSCHHGAEVV